MKISRAIGALLLTFHGFAQPGMAKEQTVGELNVKVAPEFSLSIFQNILPSPDLVTVIPAQEKYASNSIVTITAMDSDGWTFSHWTGEFESTIRTLRILMNSNKFFAAHFKTQLTTGGTGGGRIEFSNGSPFFREIVSAVVIPDPGFYFGAWGGSVSGSTNPVSFTVLQGTQLVTAAFAPLPEGQFSLTVASPEADAIRITPQRNVFATGEVPRVEVDLALTFKNLRFSGWSNGPAQFANPLRVIMNRSYVIQALIEPAAPRHAMSVTDYGLPRNLPAIADDGTVYLTTDRKLFSLTPDLRTNWVFETQLAHASNPAIGDSGAIYVAAANGSAIAVRSSGELIWRFESTEPQPQISPFIVGIRPGPFTVSADETLFVPSYGTSNVLVLRQGSLIETLPPLAGGTRRVPVIGPDGTFYFPAEGGFSAERPYKVQQWTAPFPRPSAIDSAGRLYSLAGSNVIAVSFSGAHLWTKQLDAPVKTVLVGEDERAFVETELGITVLETNGLTVWTNTTTGPIAPLTDGGAIIARATSQGDQVWTEYRQVGPDGRSGPFSMYFAGFTRHSLDPGPLVVTANGEIYVDRHTAPFMGFIEHVAGQVAVARSSWPSLWGHRNTGRAIPARDQLRLKVAPGDEQWGFSAEWLSGSAALEMSEDLQEWETVNHFSEGTSIHVLPPHMSPGKARFFRLRIDE